MSNVKIDGVPDELFSALAKAQAEMGGAKKASENPFFKSAYADLASVLKAILPALNANGLALLQFPGFDPDSGLPTLTTVISHEGGASITSTAAIPLQKADPQGYGSAISYLRRYSAQAALAVPSVDDDAEVAQDRSAAPKPKAAKAKKKPSGPDAAEKAAIRVQERIGSAETVAELYELAPDAKKLTQEWRDRIRPIYQSKIEDIQLAQDHEDLINESQNGFSDEGEPLEYRDSIDEQAAAEAAHDDDPGIVAMRERLQAARKPRRA